ncbi:TonB-dependent receptor plug domain-containing protein [Massilia sp. B-10]|nr:TonB-dependent receptor plug domain-containing protein [Massilia sp. B-10]
MAQSDTQQDMATVYVAASRSQTKVEQMPLHTTIISQEQIRMASAQTVDQLLRDVPGMNFSAVRMALSDPTGHQTKMRGLGNAKVLMLLDGVPMHDPFYLTTQWFKVPLSYIERIEILRGGNSSLWGNMAVAGVVNIVTKRPRANAGEFQASLGSMGSWNVSLSRDVAITDSVHMNLSVDQYHTDGYQTTPQDWLYRFPQKRPTDTDNRNISLTVHAQPSDPEWLRARRLPRAGPANRLPVRRESPGEPLTLPSTSRRSCQTAATSRRTAGRSMSASTN